MDNLNFYSTNTYLAYWLSCTFYHDEHFVWCSPIFDPSKLDEYHIYKKIPPSSSPFSIYRKLYEDVNNNDLHSPLIENNKNGLRKGAGLKLANKVITELEYSRILKMIEQSQSQEFRPLVYIISSNLVKDKLITVDVEESANPLSVEYQIHNLLKKEFEIMEFGKW